MARLILEEAQEFEVLPANTMIQVQVKEIEKRTVGEGDKAWDKLDFKFEIVRVFSPGYGDLEGTTIFGGVSARFTTHPDNQLRQWVEALLGMKLEAGFELETDFLKGREAKAVTRQYKTRTGSDRHAVESLIPIAEVSEPNFRPAPPVPVPVGVGAPAPRLDDSIPF